MRSYFSLHMIREFWIWAVLVAVLFVWAGSAFAQTAQEQIEKTIGSLVVQNASCSAQTLTLTNELAQAKKELADLRTKGK